MPVEFHDHWGKGKERLFIKKWDFRNDPNSVSDRIATDADIAAHPGEYDAYVNGKKAATDAAAKKAAAKKGT